MSWRTDLPEDVSDWQRASSYRKDVPAGAPQASDNDVTPKPLIYGPRGEVLLRKEPRPVGFRMRPVR